MEVNLVGYDNMIKMYEIMIRNHVKKMSNDELLKTAVEIVELIDNEKRTRGLI